MYMNHRPTRDRVYLRYTVTVETDPQIPVTPYWISVSCREEDLQRARRRHVHDRSRTWVVPRGGRIVAGAGHAHGGALSVDVADQRCGGRRLLSSDARYGLPEDPIYNFAGAARAGAAQHERGHVGDRVGGQPRRSPEDHLALCE